MGILQKLERTVDEIIEIYQLVLYILAKKYCKSYLESLSDTELGKIVADEKDAIGHIFDYRELRNQDD